MNQAHKAFLQSFMTKGVQNAKEVLELFKSCCEQYSEPHSNDKTERNQQMVEFIRTINDNVRPFHLEVKKGICEEDSTHCYCLVNTVENSNTLLASDYTASELEFVKKLVEEIIMSDGCIGSRASLNVVERLDKKMTRQEAESLLERLEQERWILQKEGMVVLSVRCILELNQYLQQVYPDSVKFCNICNLICLKGQVCEECGVKVHRHCAQIYFRDMENPRCPDRDCQAMWPHAIPESQQAAQPSSERPSRKRRQDD